MASNALLTTFINGMNDVRHDVIKEVISELESNSLVTSEIKDLLLAMVSNAEPKEKKKKEIYTAQLESFRKPEMLGKILLCQRYSRKWLAKRSVEITCAKLSKLKIHQTAHKDEGLTCGKLSKLHVHKHFKPPKSQLDYYLENDSAKEIIQYVNLQGKTFGEKYMEQIAKEYFNMNARTSSTHDHIKLNKTIEQKSARYHANGGDWKWQHIEMKHEWDYLLLCGLDFKDVKFHIASRKVVEVLIEQGIIVGQGKKVNNVAQPQQAYWFSKSDFKKHDKNFNCYFEEVIDEASLISYLNRC